MEIPQINVISLISRPDRKRHIVSEFKKEGIINYEFWNAISCYPSFKGISQSHKMIVRDAKSKNLPYVIISEDDCVFSDIGAYQYFLDNMPRTFDLYLSSVYFGQINEYSIVDDFCALTLYAIHSRYYDIFLATNEMSHIDRSQAVRMERINEPPLIIPKGKFVVSPLFCTYQLEIVSDNKQGENTVRIVSNEKYLSHRKFYSATEPFFTWDEVYQRSLIGKELVSLSYHNQ